MILYGNDRATGEEAETASEMRKRQHSSTENQLDTTIDDLDNLISTNQVILENVDNFIDIDNDIFNSSTQHPSPGSNSGTTSKKRKKEDATKERESDFELIKGAIDNVAIALKEGNALFKDSYSHKVPPISGEETWDLIKECGCDSDLIPDIYCFLMSDVDKLRSVCQCPREARKAVIMKMVFGSSNPLP